MTRALYHRSLRWLVLLLGLWGGMFLAGCNRAEPTARAPEASTVRPTATRVVVATSTLEPAAMNTATVAPERTPSPTPWRMVVIANVQANVRSDPADEARVLGTVLRGEQVEVLEVAKEWYKVRARGVDDLGWMHQSVLGEILTEDLSRESASRAVDLPAKMVVIARIAANVRSGPSESLDVVGSLERGALVTAEERSGEWYRVTAAGLDRAGWVHQEVLRLATETEVAAPATVAPTETPTPAGTPTPAATQTPLVGEATPVALGTPTQMYVAAREVANVRSGPADEAELIGTLPRGTLVVVYEVQGDWARVRSEALEGFGWVFRELLSEQPVDG